MRSLVFSLSVLALMALVHTMPCYDNNCGGNNKMGELIFEHQNANIDNSANGGGYELGQESNGVGEYNGGDSEYQGGSGNVYNGGGSLGHPTGGGSEYQEGGGSGYNGGGSLGHQTGGVSGYQEGGGSGYNGGGSLGHQTGGVSGYQGGGGYRPPPRNNYCPNCYVQDFGNGEHNANIINIKHRGN